jgi:excisionase family DNA binding protein
VSEAFEEIANKAGYIQQPVVIQQLVAAWYSLTALCHFYRPRFPVQFAQYVLFLRHTDNKRKHYRIRGDGMTKETKLLETLYSVQEAARKLGGVSKFTLYAWMRRGTLERTRVGGRVMVRESSLLKLLERGDKLEAARREGKMPQESAAHNG